MNRRIISVTLPSKNRFCTSEKIVVRRYRNDRRTGRCDQELCRWHGSRQSRFPFDTTSKFVRRASWTDERSFSSSFRSRKRFGFASIKRWKNGPVIFSVTKNIWDRRCNRILLHRRNNLVDLLGKLSLSSFSLCLSIFVHQFTIINAARWLTSRLSICSFSCRVSLSRCDFEQRRE